MVVLDEIKGRPNSAVSVMLCARATFVKKNSCLVARVVPFDIVGLLTFRILEPYLSNYIAHDLNHVIQINGIIIVHFKSYLNQRLPSFPAAKI